MIAIQEEDIQIEEMIRRAKKPETGAIVVFDGIVRDDGIVSMELEAYREVALRELEEIAEEGKRLYQLHSVEIVHRVGPLSVGENILVIVVGAAHRKEAYEGSRFIIEEIKARVPIWKREITGEGARWVHGEGG